MAAWTKRRLSRVAVRGNFLLLDPTDELLHHGVKSGVNLSTKKGADIKQISANLLQVRINPGQVRQNVFTGVGLPGIFAGATVGGIGTPGPALVHELGHAAAFFAGFPFNEFRTRATSNDWALRYENFHRSLLRGPESFRRLFHDEPQL